MRGFFEMRGSREQFEHRGRVIEIWKMISESGRRVQRRYQASVDGAPLDRWFSNRQAMLGYAVTFIESAFRPRWYDEDFYDGWDDEDLEPVPIDKHADLRAKLEQMTVERGCTEAEAAIARQKLADLDKKS